MYVGFLIIWHFSWHKGWVLKSARADVNPFDNATRQLSTDVLPHEGYLIVFCFKETVVISLQKYKNLL